MLVCGISLSAHQSPSSIELAWESVSFSFSSFFTNRSLTIYKKKNRKKKIIEKSAQNKKIKKKVILLFSRLNSLSKAYIVEEHSELYAPKTRLKRGNIQM